MKLNTLLFLITVPCLISCSRFSTQDTVTDLRNPNNTESSENPITGKYCTILTPGQFTPQNVPINLACVQDDGSWKLESNFPETPPSAGSITYYGGASLAQAGNGDPLLSYIRFTSNISSPMELMVARYDFQNHWSLISSTPVNPSNALPNEFYTQFGGRVFDFLGSPRVLWTDSTQGYLSTWNQNTWSKIQIRPTSNVYFRHPEVLLSSDGRFSYFFYGEPHPTVWKFDGIQLMSLGGPTLAISTEASLYTSLVEWNGQLVLAYTSSDYPIARNWYTETDTTKIVIQSGNSWKEISPSIQDTAGHDGVNPFLFTVNGNLFVLYSDYTTTGLPTDSQRISFRFRVKQWNGSSWTRVGAESDLIFLSQRFEFLNDNGTVLVHAFQPDPNGIGSREVILAWSNGVFSYLGQPLQNFPQKSFKMSSRPGALIRLNSH